MVGGLECNAAAVNLRQDVLGLRGPDERSGFVVVGVQVFPDLRDQIGNAVEDTAAQGFVGQFSELPLDQIRARTRTSG